MAELETVLVAYRKGLLEPSDVRRAISRLLMEKGKGVSRPTWPGDKEVVFPMDEENTLIESLSRCQRFEVNLVKDWPESQSDLADRFNRWQRVHHKARRAAQIE